MIKSVEKYLAEVRKPERAFARRRRTDFVLSALRSCSVCACILPPIDLLCPVCWRALGEIVNRSEQLKQTDYPFPVYSLLTWTPANENFVRRLIYGFKGGRNVRACETLATLFLSERFNSTTRFQSSNGQHFDFLSAPSSQFDHSALWSTVLAQSFQQMSRSPFTDITPTADGPSNVKSGAGSGQKMLTQSERGHRRFELQEEFAYLARRERGSSMSGPPAKPRELGAKSIVFADDVITSGATAMAAYMALGDPDGFEVWTLAARPRLAAKSSVR